MDIRQLRRFVTVADLGSFNKAAEALAVSQPSLSRSIQMLEHSFDVKLFERSSRGIGLTIQGEELLPHARIILTERDRALAAINTLRRRREERLTIGSEPMFAIHRLPLAISRLAVSDPHLKFTIREGNFHDMLEQVREGSLHMALGSNVPDSDLSGLVFEQLSVEGASLLMRSGHPLLKNGKLTLKDVVKTRWIVPENKVLYQRWTQIFLSQELPIPEIAVRTSSFLLMKGCLLNSDLISMGNHREFANEIKEGQLVKVDFGKTAYLRPVGLFWRAEAVLSRSEKSLVSALRKVCQ